MNLDAILSALLIFGAACYLLFGARLILSKRATGTLPIGILFLIISIWIFGGAIELMSETYAIFSIGRTGHFIGSALVPVIAYFCFREYVGSDTPVSRLVLLLVIPVISIGLASSNIHHQLMWLPPFVNDAGVFLTRPDSWGPWFLFIHMPYSYAVVGAAILTLISRSSAVTRAQRRGLSLLIAACVLPLGAAVYYDMGFGPNTISFIPFAFMLMLPVYGWLIFGEQIIEYSPLAYETVFQNMQDPVVVIDDDGRVIGLNHTAESLLDVNETTALREPLQNLFGDDSSEVFEALESGKPQKMLTATGRFLHIQVSEIAKNRESARGGQVLMFRDVSDVEKAQAEVRRREQLLRTIIDHTANGVVRFRWVCDRRGNGVLKSIFANSAAGRFLGKQSDELIDVDAHEIICLATCGMDDDSSADILRKFETAIRSGGILDVEVWHRHLGRGRWLRLVCERVGDDIAATMIDITDTKAKERQMDSIAVSDPLTGVLNRRGFEREASRRLTESADDATGALLFIDLNGFKQINDKYGHEIGDQLLTVAAERLKKNLRSRDIIGRPGGDEFVALVPDVNAEIAERLAKRLTEALEESYVIGSNNLECAASIGLALYPDNANTLTGLLREADQAMYRAKERSRACDKVESSDLLEKAV